MSTRQIVVEQVTKQYATHTAVDPLSLSFLEGHPAEVDIAIALAKRAKALLLDEPRVASIPARGRKAVSREGAAVLTATHDLVYAHQAATH